MPLMRQSGPPAVRPVKRAFRVRPLLAATAMLCVLGAAAVLLMQPILPYALSFAAGAMIYVVVEELIPESQQGQDTHMSTIGAMLGFAVMMILDVALG